MLTIILIIISVVVLNGIVSAIEAAIFSVPINRARLLAEKGYSGKVLLKLKERIHRPIVAIISLSNLITVMGSVFAGIFAARIFGDNWVGLFAAVMTFIFMIFGEIAPKRIGERYAERIAVKVAVPLWFVSDVFHPIAFIIEKLTGRFIVPRPSSTSEEEIAFLARTGFREGVIEGDESEMVRRAFKLNDVKAGDVMTPRSSVFFLNGDKTVEEAKKEIYRSEYSKMPVFERSKNNVIGIAYKTELLKLLAENKGGLKIKNITHPPFIISKDMLCDELLREFQRGNQRLAVVLGDQSKVLGLVSLEDVLEELVGEISEEKPS